MKENGVSSTKQYMKDVNLKLLFERYFNIESSKNENVTDEPEHFEYGVLNKILFTNKNIVVDVKEYLDNEKCFFALYEKENGKTSRISKFFYHENGCCYNNNFIEVAIGNSWNLVKEMNDLSLKMKLTKIKSVNTQQATIENFESLYGVVFDQSEIIKFFEMEKDKNGIIICESDASAEQDNNNQGD